MTDEHKALVEALNAAAQDWRELSYPDEAEMLEQAAHAIRELSAEVESLARWKETVRDLYDAAHFNREYSATGRRIIAHIESRHPEYFCEPKENHHD